VLLARARLAVLRALIGLLLVAFHARFALCFRAESESAQLGRALALSSRFGTATREAKERQQWIKWSKFGPREPSGNLCIWRNFFRPNCCKLSPPFGRQFN